MNVISTRIPDLLILEPHIYGDERGYFMESYNQKVFSGIVGREVSFVQDNHSRSGKGVLRGIHYQIECPQGKLVRVVSGCVYDVAVDLRKSSPHFGQWVGVELSEKNKRMFWLPEGFGHGFVVLSEQADFLYKTTDYYAPEHERCIRWDDPEIGINWPLDTEPQLSAKDKQALPFSKAEMFE